ncbi:hypothetical protein L226DRAFT_617302 [Lentinus tigrinus ALCF2SS1-7]|uniref:Uncharacterized protein n=1 Tax=Lentinus tigrinus ALCF2SS1-6 TaxID=1328759 RepID=A0A5C2S673_9APHY|nr:hypothetical protein L227DRAFT_653998 [Lentinus tigrinus ALCF2SS1-6]RPD68738.1 hypothetical protein L226DRAFT_617302 [Lentinus tigrinus ALCF2SS1-7]
MVSHSTVKWEDVSDPVPSATPSQGDLGERISQDALRLPTGSEPGLKRFWPIPLYAVACFVHVRYRLWRPRVLPRLTTLSLPETYGALALGHAADIEADTLINQLLQQEDSDWLYIHLYSVGMHKWSHDFLDAQRKNREKIWVDITRPGVLGKPYEGNILFETFDWEHSRPLLALRNLWSDGSSRELAGLQLYRAIHTLGLNDHDARILVRYVAERMYTGEYYHPTLVVNHLSHLQTYQGAIPLWFGAFTATRLCLRWIGLAKWIIPYVEMYQQTAFHVWVYRTLWGRYRHWESLSSLEDPAKAKAVVVATLEMHLELLKARLDELKQTGKK